MKDQVGTNSGWLAVFRMAANDGWLDSELRHGRLRQGWGPPGLELTRDGERVAKADWEATHRNIDWGDPSPKRFAILSRMLDIKKHTIVVIPKMPRWNQFSIARVSDDYRFDVADGRDDFGHILPLDPESVRTFHYHADDDAFLVSGLFSRANHRPPLQEKEPEAWSASSHGSTHSAVFSVNTEPRMGPLSCVGTSTSPLHRWTTGGTGINNAKTSRIPASRTVSVHAFDPLAKRAGSIWCAN